MPLCALYGAHWHHRYAQPFAPSVPEAPGIWQVGHSVLWIAEGTLCLPCWLNTLWAALCCSRGRVAESGHKAIVKRRAITTSRDVALLEQLDTSRFSKEWRRHLPEMFPNHISFRQIRLCYGCGPGQFHSQQGSLGPIRASVPSSGACRLPERSVSISRWSLAIPGSPLYCLKVWLKGDITSLPQSFF